MKHILFATGNKRKLHEARAGCGLCNVAVEQVELHIDEIQSHDPLAIGRRKAADAFAQLGRPVVVADTFWDIPALGGFPGGYMKDVAEWFAPQDFINLFTGKRDRRISFTETIVYQDSRQVRSFSRQYWGEAASQPRGNSGNAWDKVAEFNGRTFAESQDAGQTSHNPEEYIWYQFAQWFDGLPQEK